MPLSPLLGTLAGGLGCSPLDDRAYPRPSHSRAPPRTLRGLARLGSRTGPSPHQCPTRAGLGPEAAPQCLSGRTSYLRVRLAFHHLPPAPPTVLPHGRVRASSPWSRTFTLARGSSRGFGSAERDCALFGLAFAPAPGLQPLNLATPSHSPAHSSIGTPSGRRVPAPSDRLSAHGFRLSFTPLPGFFSPFPHGTGPLSVARGR